MRVVFHIISTGGGAGASRTTRYIAERDRDPTREGSGPRTLFSQDQDGLTYRKADRILEPDEGRPEKDDLIHVWVSFEEEDFQKLGRDEKERQTRLQGVIRDGMKGMAEELKVERLTWVAGIHRNSDNPHAHVVIRKDITDRLTGKDKQLGRIHKSLLPHKQVGSSREVIVPGRIGERFLAALDMQQALCLNPEYEKAKTKTSWERLVENIKDKKSQRSEHAQNETSSDPTREQRIAGWERVSSQSLQRGSLANSWNQGAALPEDDHVNFRVALGKYMEFRFRVTFAEVWYQRAVERGDTYRFEVVDQSTSEEKKISELDVHRRAAARAQRVSPPNRASREQAFEEDLSRHRETLDRLNEAREAKIAALGRDVGSLRGTLSKLEQGLAKPYDIPNDKIEPLMSRETLSGLQEQAVKLRLTDTVWELEKLRIALAREHNAPVRNDDEAATLAAQVNVARADLMARDTRLENFEASAM